MKSTLVWFVKKASSLDAFSFKNDSFVDIPEFWLTDDMPLSQKDVFIKNVLQLQKQADWKQMFVPPPTGSSITNWH